MTCRGSMRPLPACCPSHCAACGMSPWACWRRCGQTVGGPAPARDRQHPGRTSGSPRARAAEPRSHPRATVSQATALCPGRSLLLRLYEASGGNPLFALELAAKAMASGSPGLIDGIDVPDSLRQLVGGRLTGLPRGTRDVLLVSALAAEPALPVICAAARQPATAHATSKRASRRASGRYGRPYRLRSPADALGRDQARRAPTAAPPTAAGRRRAGRRGAGTSPGHGS